MGLFKSIREAKKLKLLYDSYLKEDIGTLFNRLEYYIEHLEESSTEREFKHHQTIGKLIANVLIQREAEFIAYFNPELTPEDLDFVDTELLNAMKRANNTTRAELERTSKLENPVFYIILLHDFCMSKTVIEAFQNTIRFS